MKTPIADFVKNYAESGTVRLHMPGHKGNGLLGVEALDITEISGADVLNEADGIIGESERNAASVFGTHKTFYSTEGSSQVIKTMLALVNANKKHEKCRILAARNVHKSFVYGAALCDIEVEWLFSDDDHLCSSKVTKEALQLALESAEKPFDAVYITSPDYLGNLQDVKALATVCDKYKLPLLVDNAHGAYLAFLQESLHPIHLGASMCTDSAHKTLPVLTGGAYLHVAEKYEVDSRSVRSTMSIFGSTSPSYLVLQSLDLCNRYLEENYRENLKNTANLLQNVKKSLKSHGFCLVGNEPLKITIDTAKFGYFGTETVDFLRKNGIEPEFSDNSFVVMMFTPQNTEAEIIRLCELLCSLPQKEAIEQETHSLGKVTNAISIREAVFAAQETVPIEMSVGRICGVPTVSCPPAVPVAVSGEMITAEAVRMLKYCGITSIGVVK